MGIFLPKFTVKKKRNSNSDSSHNLMLHNGAPCKYLCLHINFVGVSCCMDLLVSNFLKSEKN